MDERLVPGACSISHSPSVYSAVRALCQPALFMTVRREVAEPRRETGARSREDPMRTRVVR